MPPRIGIIADDFTSAMDGAGPFVASGAVGSRGRRDGRGRPRAGRRPRRSSTPIPAAERPRHAPALIETAAELVASAEVALQDRRLDAPWIPRRRDRGGMAGQRPATCRPRAGVPGRRANHEGRPAAARRRRPRRELVRPRCAARRADRRDPAAARAAAVTALGSRLRPPASRRDRDLRCGDRRRPGRDRDVRRRRRRALDRLARHRARAGTETRARRPSGRRSRRSTASPSSSGRCTR